MFRWFLIILDSVLGVAFVIAGFVSLNLISGVICGLLAAALFKNAQKNYRKRS